MKRLLRQYVRWHQRDVAELTELGEKLQQAQQAVIAAEQAAAEAQEALQLERAEVMAANHRAEQRQAALQAALQALRQATTDGEALATAVHIVWGCHDLVKAPSQACSARSTAWCLV